ncbi:MAG: HIT domain-containing protein, partial [Pseudomonadota bacterium]
MQIVTRAHYETFLDVPGALLADMARLGQRIGRLQKRRYRAPRIGFVFTGNEVPHVHAHVLPLYASDDITSARFRTGEARFISAAEQSETAQELRDLMEGRGDG